MQFFICNFINKGAYINEVKKNKCVSKGWRACACIKVLKDYFKCLLFQLHYFIVNFGSEVPKVGPADQKWNTKPFEVAYQQWPWLLGFKWL